MANYNGDIHSSTNQRILDKLVDREGSARRDAERVFQKRQHYQ